MYRQFRKVDRIPRLIDQLAEEVSMRMRTWCGSKYSISIEPHYDRTLVVLNVARFCSEPKTTCVAEISNDSIFFFGRNVRQRRLEWADPKLFETLHELVDRTKELWGDS